MSDNELKAHQAAEVFPALEGAEFDALVADMREHGQCEPIVVHDGEILDGRNRYRACLVLGIDPVTANWNGEGSPEAFVISKNIMRRHLTPSQRAMIAATLATAIRGERRDLVAEATTTTVDEADEDMTDERVRYRDGD